MIPAVASPRETPTSPRNSSQDSHGRNSKHLLRSSGYKNLHRHFEEAAKNFNDSKKKDLEDDELIQRSGKPRKSRFNTPHLPLLHCLKEFKKRQHFGSDISSPPATADIGLIKKAKSEPLECLEKRVSKAKLCRKVKRIKTKVEVIIRSLSEPIILHSNSSCNDIVRCSDISALKLKIRQSPPNQIPARNHEFKVSPRGLKEKLLSPRKMSLSLPASPKCVDNFADREVAFSERSINPPLAKKGSNTPGLEKFIPSIRDRLPMLLPELPIKKDAILTPVAKKLIENPYFAELREVATIMYQKTSNGAFKRKEDYQLKLSGQVKLQWKKEKNRECSKDALSYILNLFEKSLQAGFEEFECKAHTIGYEEPMMVGILDLLEMLTNNPQNHTLITMDTSIRRKIIDLNYQILYGKPTQDAQWILKIINECESHLLVLWKCIQVSQQEFIGVLKKTHLNNKTLSDCDDNLLNYIADELGLSSAFGSCNRTEMIAHLTTLFTNPGTVLVEDGRCILPFSDLKDRIQHSVQQFLHYSLASHHDILKFIKEEDSFSDPLRQTILNSFHMHQYRECLFSALKRTSLAFENSNENFIIGIKTFILQIQQALKWKNLLSKKLEDQIGITLHCLKRPIEWSDLICSLESLSIMVKNRYWHLHHP